MLQEVLSRVDLIVSVQGSRKISKENLDFMFEKYQLSDEEREQVLNYCNEKRIVIFEDSLISPAIHADEEKAVGQKRRRIIIKTLIVVSVTLVLVFLIFGVINMLWLPKNKLADEELASQTAASLTEEETTTESAKENMVSADYCPGIMSQLAGEVRARGYQYYNWHPRIIEYYQSQGFEFRALDRDTFCVHADVRN